jgi:DNA-binding GntR family transcriptional regulator
VPSAGKICRCGGLADVIQLLCHNDSVPTTKTAAATTPDVAAPAGPAPLERVSTVEALERALRERILGGELGPGTHLREANIASAYHVGRYTVRAAFQSLAHRGIVVHEQNRGVSVLDPTPRVMSDVYTMRAAIEAESARLMVERGVALDAVREAVERLLALPDDAPAAELVQADLAVHQAVVETAASPRMLQAFIAIRDQVMLFLSTAAPDERFAALLASSKKDHQEILTALESGDPDQAPAAIRRHLYVMIID